MCLSISYVFCHEHTVGLVCPLSMCSCRSHPSNGCPVTTPYFNINCDSGMSSCQNHFLRSANTVFYIKCLDKRKQKEKVALSSQNGPYEVQKFINMIDFFFWFFFLESVSGGIILNIPLGTTLYSYDGLISHFLGRLGRHRTLGGVRPFHIGHEQAHFLIGPPPLRVQLTVIPKWHLRLGGRRVEGGKRGGDNRGKDGSMQLKIFETE